MVRVAYLCLLSSCSLSSARRVGSQVKSTLASDGCTFSGDAPLQYFWDPSCLSGGSGCDADGVHPECRFCGQAPYPDCPSGPAPAPTPPAPVPVPTPSPAPSPGAEEYLKKIDSFLDQQPRNAHGFLQIYGPGSFGGGDCGAECELVEPCPNFAVTPHCRFDTYDNALAAIYYVKRGKLAEAERILKGFLDHLYPPYAIQHSYDGLPSERSVTLLAASYSDVEADAGDYFGAGVSDGAVDVGNNAWAGMAFAHYAAATGSECHATAARDILEVITKHTACNDGFGGFMGRLPPYTRFYRSVEHNIDMAAFARMLGASTDQSKAQQFVRTMYAKDPDYPTVYAVGTGNDGECDAKVGHEPIAVDAQLWNLVAGADSTAAHVTDSLAYTLQQRASNAPGDSRLVGHRETDQDLIGHNGQGVGETYHGFRFTNWGNGIQWENTASGLMALVRYRSEYGEGPGVSSHIIQIRDSIKRLINVYGSVPASVLGGNIDAWHKVDHQAAYPGGSDTGIGWTYLRYPHLASTVWAGFALMQQGDEGETVNDQANPYWPPSAPVPGTVAKGSCLPPEAAAPSESCSGNPGCAPLGLGGNCCPTDSGMFLGCCS